MKLVDWMQKAHRDLVQLDLLAQIITAYCQNGDGVGCLLAENYALTMPEGDESPDPFCTLTFHCVQAAYPLSCCPVPACPPDAAQSEQEAADVFCLGLLLYTMLTGKTADPERADMLLNLVEAEEPLPFLTAPVPDNVPLIWQLVERMTDLNLSTRPTMAQLLEQIVQAHPGTCRIALTDKGTLAVLETVTVPLLQAFTNWTPAKSYSYQGRGYLPFALNALSQIPYRLCEMTYTAYLVSDCLPEPEKTPVQQIAEGFCMAVDLGTWNSSVSYIDPYGYAKDLCVDGDPLIPSAIGYLTKTTCCFGKEALQLQTTHPWAVLRGFKRQIASGTTVTLTAKDGSVVETTYEAIVVQFLQHLAQQCQQMFGSLQDAHVVLTVPACYDPGRKTALCEAMKAAGFPAPHILTEPEAAGIYFGTAQASSRYAVVLDVGGGTSDVSLLAYDDAGIPTAQKRIRSKKIAGIGQLGGVDFTNRVMAELLRTLRTKHGLFLEGQAASGLSEWQYRLNCQRLLDAAEAIKILLTQQEAVTQEVSLFFPDRTEAETIPFQLKRRGYEVYVKQEVAQLRKCIQSLLAAQHLQPKDIGQLIITGGGSLSPCVRRNAAEVFAGTDCKVQYVDYSTAISRGGAVYANDSSLEIPTKQALSETNYDLGVQVTEGYGGRPRFRMLLSAGTSFAEGDLEAEPVQIFLRPEEITLGFCQLVLYQRKAGYAHVEGSYAADGDVIQPIGTFSVAQFPRGFDPKNGSISFRILLDAQECVTAKVDFYSPRPRTAQEKLTALLGREQPLELVATQTAAYKPR